MVFIEGFVKQDKYKQLEVLFFGRKILKSLVGRPSLCSYDLFHRQFALVVAYKLLRGDVMLLLL